MINTAILGKANLGIHIFQGLWSVVVMGVTIATMVQEGPTSGAAKYIFAMCWITVPALVYLTMTPRFQRTRMFAHPYWVIGINTIFMILWFAAFVALAAYTNSGISAGEDKTKNDKDSKSGCAAFKDGTGEAEKACTLNRSIVGLGVLMWFCWLTTFGIAGWAAYYFKLHSVSPFEDLTTPSHDIQETTKNAFSTANDDYALINKPGEETETDYDDYPSTTSHAQSYSPHDNDIEAGRSEYGGGGRSEFGHSAVGGRSEYGQSAVGGRSDYNPTSEYGHGRSGSVASTYDEYAHPGRPVSWAAEREPYDGIGGHGSAPPIAGSLVPSSSPGIVDPRPGRSPVSDFGGPIAPIDIPGPIVMPEGPDDYLGGRPYR